MSASDLLLKLGKATFEIRDVSDGLALIAIGEIDIQQPSAEIRPFLSRLHDSILARNIKMLELNFHATSYMNSSGIKEFVNLIMKLSTTPKDQKYRIRIRYSKDITWQAASLPILSKIQPDQIQVVSE